jgi:hypothetical protein
MKKDNKLTTFHGGAYASPSVAIVCLEGQGKILEPSKGQTENYSSLPIWELGDDNE